MHLTPVHLLVAAKAPTKAPTKSPTKAPTKCALALPLPLPPAHSDQVAPVHSAYFLASRLQGPDQVRARLATAPLPCDPQWRQNAAVRPSLSAPCPVPSSL